MAAAAVAMSVEPPELRSLREVQVSDVSLWDKVLGHRDWVKKTHLSMKNPSSAISGAKTEKVHCLGIQNKK